MKRSLPHVLAAASTALLTAVGLLLTPVSAAARPAPISKYAFDMHFLRYGTHSYPRLTFASDRIWSVNLAWKDLQPTQPATPGAMDANALARLDSLVDGFHAHHVDPILVFGWTPAWAADGCNHKHNGHDYGVQTCAPKDTSTRGAWGTYVRTLATRYDGHHGHAKVTYFETWNEADLPFGWMDSITKLAQVQYSAYKILHGLGHGQKLLSPSLALSYGYAPVSLSWFNTFFKRSGSKAFDVFNVHLYPTVPVSKANIGPEWAIRRLAEIRTILSKHHVHKPVWDTELNLGSAPGRVKFGGTAGAAQVDRSLVLATSSHVARTYWYAADDRSWGGVWLEGSDYKSLTAAGKAYNFMARTLTRARPYGCSVKTVGKNKWNYICRYHLASGKNMLAVWTTGRSYHYHAPVHTQYLWNAIGARHHATHATRLTVSHTPFFVVGSFRI